MNDLRKEWDAAKARGESMDDFMRRRTLESIERYATQRYYSVRNGRGCGHIHKNWESAMKCENYSPFGSRLVKYVSDAQDPRY